VWEASKKSYVPVKYSLDRNNTIASLFRTQYNPQFLDSEVLWFAEHYFLGDWGSRLIMSCSSKISTSFALRLRFLPRLSLPHLVNEPHALNCAISNTAIPAPVIV
jgi:hypothetical protein